MHQLQPAHKLYVYMGAIFVACLLLGDIVGGKTIATPLGPISVGIIPFRVTFLLTDVVNDFYGRKGATFLTWLGFWMAALAYVVLQISTYLHADPSTYFTQTEFAKVFGGSAQLFIASIVAYLLGQILDIHVFQFWKALTQSRHLWLRATGSTVLSQVIDTVTINVIFWRWTVSKDWSWIGYKAGREYLIKLVIAIALTPAVYAVHTFVVKVMKIEPEPHESKVSQ
jgi:uncharacterized integral membrane protein (TIGR00697 family)